LIFEEEVVVENPKETIVEIRNESNLEITRNDDSKLNESGLNALTEFIKNSQNKPITEKVENLIQVFSNNKLNSKKINLDNKTKNELLHRLREEFQKEKEIIEEETKQIQTKSKLSNNIKVNKNSSMTSDLDFNVTNPFTKNVLEGSNNQPNESNFAYANQGWGVGNNNISNNKSKQTRKTNSVENNIPKTQIKKENMTVNKFKNAKTPNKIVNKFKEDERNFENNFWIGDQLKNEEEDSEEWMVLK
jgi:hypothetical protein